LIDAADVQTRMNKPVVSVVMVVCNVDRFLAEAIESILGQTFHEFEFIIVDFGSTDKSKEIVSSYAAKDSRIRLYEIPHCGLGEARNAACFLARGQYIAIMDADDVSLPDRLIREVEFLEEHPEVGVVGGAVDWIDATGVCVTNTAVPPGVTLSRPEGNRELQLALLKDCPIWQPSVLMRRDAFVLVGGYRPAFAPTEDYDLWLRISEHFEMANLKEVVLKYRIHPYQVSLRKGRQQTLCKLAAQVSASSRRNGKPDPLNSAREITPQGLAALGVTEARQQNELASGRRQWIRHMCMAGEYAVALQAAEEILQSDLKQIERWQIADLRLTAAGLYWQKGKFLRSTFSAVQAVLTSPAVLGRPLKPILRRLGRA
jgi:hypothetical protein